jgi:hypothetical protein
MAQQGPDKVRAGMVTKVRRHVPDPQRTVGRAVIIVRARMLQKRNCVRLISFSGLFID